MVHLIIEVRSRQANCGLALDPDSSDMTGQSYHSFTIVHRLTGNNDAFIQLMRAALVRLTDGQTSRMFVTMTEQFNTIIRLTVDDLQQMYLTAMAAQMEYESLVHLVAKNLQDVPAVG